MMEKYIIFQALKEYDEKHYDSLNVEEQRELNNLLDKYYC